MKEPFDGSFFAAAGLVAASVAIAIAAWVNPSLPVIGSGRGALLAVAVLGFAGCTLGGLSEVSTLGWAHPYIVLGSVLGVVALVIIVSGLFGFEGLLRPVAGVLPGVSSVGVSTDRIAVVAIAGVIVLKWVIGFAYSLMRSNPV